MTGVGRTCQLDWLARKSGKSALCEFATCAAKVSYRKFALRFISPLWVNSSYRRKPSGAMMVQNRVLHRRKSALSLNCELLRGAWIASRAGTEIFVAAAQNN